MYSITAKLQHPLAPALHRYELLGFVSHIGKHTSHGHYVCHMRLGHDMVFLTT